MPQSFTTNTTHHFSPINIFACQWCIIEDHLSCNVSSYNKHNLEVSLYNKHNLEVSDSNNGVHSGS